MGSLSIPLRPNEGARATDPFSLHRFALDSISPDCRETGRWHTGTIAIASGKLNPTDPAGTRRILLRSRGANCKIETD